MATTVAERKKQVNVSDIQEACKNDLHFLCTQILGYGDWDKCHDDVEVILKRPSKRKLIMMPRGHLKTSFITKAYSIQCLLKNPDIRILIANQVWDRSREMLFEIKEFLTDKSDLHKIFGNFMSKRWREDEVVISQRKKALSAPTVGTTGVEAEMTGSHYDLIILDDLQGLTNCQTKEQRDKVKRFYRSMTALLDPGGQLVVLGTRWHFDDYYQDIMDNESDYFDVMVRKVVEDNKVIFPKKFNLKFSEEKKDWLYHPEPTLDYVKFLRKTMGPDFYSQYLNEPIDSENQLIKQEYFQYYQETPPSLFVVMTVDPAITLRYNADYTAIIVCGMDPQRKIFVLDTMRGRWGSPQEVINQIFVMQEKWKPQVVGIETMGFQKTLKYGMEEEMRRRNHFFPITDLKALPQINKVTRMKALEPYYRNRMIFHRKGMMDLEQELMNLTIEGYKGRHDDLIDCLAYQLDLLNPGTEYIDTRIPTGSWEAEVREAHRLLNPYDFFKE